MHNLQRVGKNDGPILAVCGLEVRDILKRCRIPCSFQLTCTIVYVAFLSEDIGR